VTKPFRNQYGNRELDTITADEILPFPIDLINGAKQSTQKLRCANLKAFFNFIRNTFQPNLENPREAPMLKKIFKAPKKVPWAMLETHPMFSPASSIMQIKVLRVFLTARYGMPALAHAFFHIFWLNGVGCSVPPTWCRPNDIERKTETLWMKKGKVWIFQSNIYKQNSLSRYG